MLILEDTVCFNLSLSWTGVKVENMFLLQDARLADSVRMSFSDVQVSSGWLFALYQSEDD